MDASPEAAPAGVSGWVPGAAAEGAEAAPRPVHEIPDPFARSGGAAAGGVAGQRRQGPRADRQAALDKSSDAPNGCVFKRFSPLSSQPYWYGQLPEGQTSPGGRHSRKLTWGFFTQRSEAETESVILQWLHDNAQTGWAIHYRLTRFTLGRACVLLMRFFCVALCRDFRPRHSS